MRWLGDCEADAFVASLFRVAFSLVGIGYLLAYFVHLDFAWIGKPIWLGRGLLAAAIATLALILFGIEGRWTRIAHFMLVSVALGQTFPYVTINEEIYIIVAFWSCFMGSNRGWPALLLGVNLGVYLLSAGLFKLFDPLWRNGLGFYGALLLPHLRPDFIAPLTDFRWLMLTSDVVVIAMELLVLPLVIFRRTRWLAALVLALFFAGLVFPLRIDWIGLVGLPSALAVASISPAASRWLRRLAGRSPSAPPAGRPAGRLAVVLAVLVAYLSFDAILHTPWSPYGTFPPHPQGEPVATPERSPVDALRRQLVRWTRPLYPSLASTVNRHTLFLGPKPLFTHHHQFDVWAFRVEAELKDGGTLPVIEVFERDKSGGRHMRSLGMPRFYQGCMYPIGHLARHLARGLSPRGANTSVADAVLRWSFSPDEMREVRLLVSPIVMPIRLEGHVEPWKQQPWTLIRSFDGREFRFRDRPELYPYTLGL